MLATSLEFETGTSGPHGELITLNSCLIVTATTLCLCIFTQDFLFIVFLYKRTLTKVLVNKLMEQF